MRNSILVSRKATNAESFAKSSVSLRAFLCICLFAFFLSGCISKTKEHIAENEFYVCSMDPQVMEKEPGLCPICKMVLTKKVIDKTDQNLIKLNKEQIRLGNIQTDTVRTDSISSSKTFTGIFAINQNSQQQIAARYNGRIEKLYFKVPGQEIKWGDLLYKVYSRDLMLAQEEYLFALEKAKLLSGGATNLIESAKNKLLLWGFTEFQVQTLEKDKEPKIVVEIRSKVSGVITEIPFKEGDYINEGATLYKLTDLNSLWVEAQVYANELDFISEGEKVEVIPQAFPDETLQGEIDFSNPEMQPETKINLIRIKVPNEHKKFVPGMMVSVIINKKTTEKITVSTDAVVQNGTKSHVWIRNKDGDFEPRQVVLGKQTKSNIEIVSGLTVGETIVVSGAYLLYSDYVFKTGHYPLSTDTAHTDTKNNMPGMKM